MPHKVCTEAGCPNPVLRRGLCATHLTHQGKGYRTTKAIYHTRRWLLLRRHVLHHHPICQHCDRELATDVDHITPLDHDGDPWALANLQALCNRCHGRKTHRELRLVRQQQN